VCQDAVENRSIVETLDLGWDLIGVLPRDELSRLSEAEMDQYLPGQEE
jgi:V/A-type H+-transporting ATPase subunit B